MNFGTGESFLDDQFLPFIYWLRDFVPDIRISVTTNGTMAIAMNQDKRVSQLFDEVDVSIDSIVPAEHNQVRGVSWAFEYARRTLETCREAGVKTTIVMVGIEATLRKDNLRGLMQMARQLGCCLRVNLYRPTEGSVLEMPSYHCVMDAMDCLHGESDGATLSDPLFSALFASAQGGFVRTQSKACRILPDGTITPSTYLTQSRWRGSSILDSGDVLSAFMHSNAYQMFAQPSSPARCRSCPWIAVCQGGATDRRWLAGGSLNEPDPYCPMLHGQSERLQQRELQFAPIANGPQIHTSYMPTLVFHPREADSRICTISNQA